MRQPGTGWTLKAADVEPWQQAPVDKLLNVRTPSAVYMVSVGMISPSRLSNHLKTPQAACCCVVL